MLKELPEVPNEVLSNIEDFFSEEKNPALQSLKDILFTALSTQNDELLVSLLEKYPLTVHITGLPPSSPFLNSTVITSALHIAAAFKYLGGLQLLIQNGHPWNAVDSKGTSAGQIALQAKFTEGYEWLVSEGVRSELILGILDDGEMEDVEEDTERLTNGRYLKQKLLYTSDGNRLLDADNNGVMMGWEAPLMLRHAQLFAQQYYGSKDLNFESNGSSTENNGPVVLNVGFGLGLVDSYLQKYCNPKSHTIIEAHPDVYNQMIALGWDKKPGVKILFGRWQDMIVNIEEAFDIIYWDTFAEEYKDFKEFNENIPNILKQTGIYSYFNGLGGTNQFFHDVYCQVATADLQDLGLETEFIDIDLEKESESNTLFEVNQKEESNNVWTGIRRAYWTLPTYRLPICRFLEY